MLLIPQALSKTTFSAVNSLIMEQSAIRRWLVENIGQYIVGSGGKRLRPVVVLLSALGQWLSGDKHIAWLR